MSNQPLISIIILNYNGKEFIKECIDSVLKSNYSAFEIIILDNASTDGSFALLKKLYQNNQKIRILRSDKQLYFAGGCNFGAKYAKGEKLVFLNSDTIVDKNWLTGLIDFAKDNDKYLVQPKILCFPQTDIIDNAGGRYQFPGFGFGIGRGKKDIGQYNQNAEIDFANGTCFLIDKKFFEELGGFDEWFKLQYEDVDLNLRAKKNKGKSWYSYKSIIYHKGSLSIKKNVPEKDLIFYIRRNRLRTVIKNYSGLKRICWLTALLITYLILTIRDLFLFKGNHLILTFRSIKEAINLTQ